MLYVKGRGLRGPLLPLYVKERAAEGDGLRGPLLPLYVKGRGLRISCEVRI